MKLANNELINLPVYTKGGTHLGHIASFELDSDTGKIENFYVKTGLVQGLWHEKLVINQSQVIEITQEKMVVEDNVVKQRLPGFKLVPAVE